mmetsp:Transcript_16522/g.24726  ORF Transcript_16522/g.24726 Transcript_16522/m.24726 type:complete len:218 (-) Transcript_16522:423-1076(-)
MPWEDDLFVPRTKSGKQKSPNMIRNELQCYIDQCKSDRSDTQTGIIQRMGVNNKSFRNFMNPKTYKNPSSAYQISTYWKAAKLLEQVKHEKEQAKKNNKKKSGKRKASPTTTFADIIANDATNKKARTESTSSSAATTASAVATATVVTPLKETKAEVKLEATNLVERICAVENVPDDHPVYDTCPQVVTKIKKFLLQDGMTKKYCWMPVVELMATQ